MHDMHRLIGHSQLSGFRGSVQSHFVFVVLHLGHPLPLTYHRFLHLVSYLCRLVCPSLHANFTLDFHTKRIFFKLLAVLFPLAAIIAVVLVVGTGGNVLKSWDSVCEGDFD